MLRALMNKFTGYTTPSETQRSPVSPNYASTQEGTGFYQANLSPSTYARVPQVFGQAIQRDFHTLVFINTLGEISVKVTNLKNQTTLLREDQILVKIPTLLSSTWKSFKDSSLKQKKGIKSVRIQVLETLDTRTVRIRKNSTSQIVQLQIGEKDSKNFSQT